MNTRACRSWHGGHINNEITNLAIEVVLIGIPIGATIFVRVSIDECHTFESWSSFNSGKSDGVSDKLSVIILDDWSADEVSTGWEVNKSWCGGARVTAFAASVAICDCFVDGGGIIGVAVAWKNVRV